MGRLFSQYAPARNKQRPSAGSEPSAARQCAPLDAGGGLASYRTPGAVLEKSTMAADVSPSSAAHASSARLSGPARFRRFMLAGMASISYPGTRAEQLLLAPQELRTADPSFATELYNGHLGLAGRLAEVEIELPFEIAPPSDGWARELYGFGWLRHLRAAGSELSREQAKALVQDFIALKRSHHGLAWQPEIVGRRVISWLSNSVLILDSGEPEAYANFLRALTSQLRYLSASYRDAPDGVPRLVALMALIYAGLCIAEQQAVVDRYARPFGRESSTGRSSPMAGISRATPTPWSSCCSIFCRCGNASWHATAPRRRS